MRKAIVVVLLCAAGAGLYLLWRESRRAEESRPEPVAKTPPPPDAPEEAPRRTDWRQRPPTRTSLEESEALSELERAIQRDDLSRAHYFRQLVAEDIDGIMSKPKLARNLLDLIRTYGCESDDLRRRDVLFGLLRIVEHPEATQMIEEQYYQARTDEERMMLLDALSRPHHDPQKASVLAIERALNAESEEHRWVALDSFQHNNIIPSPKLVYETAAAVYEGTVHAKQREHAVELITRISMTTPEARDWVRERLRNPRQEELVLLAGQMAAWATPEDAAMLEMLAEEYPMVGDQLREIAEDSRRTRLIREAEERGEEPPVFDPPEKRE